MYLLLVMFIKGNVVTIDNLPTKVDCNKAKVAVESTFKPTFNPVMEIKCVKVR